MLIYHWLTFDQAMIDARSHVSPFRRPAFRDDYTRLLVFRSIALFLDAENIPLSLCVLLKYSKVHEALCVRLASVFDINILH